MHYPSEIESIFSVQRMPPNLVSLNAKKGFPCGSDSKESTCNVGDPGSIPRLGRSPGEGNGNSFQYSCLENSLDRRSLAGYSPQGCKESDMTEQLHFHFLSMQKGGLPWWLSSKESACNAGATGYEGSIPGLGRAPGGGHGNPLSVLAWEIPWTEESGGLQCIEWRRVRSQTEVT